MERKENRTSGFRHGTKMCRSFPWIALPAAVAVVVFCACDGSSPPAEDSTIPDLSDAATKPKLNCDSTKLIDLMVCEDDKDCVYAKADCCGCKSGGNSDAINMKCLAQHKKSFYKCPNPYNTCKAVEFCGSGIKCVNWYCEIQYD